MVLFLTSSPTGAYRSTEAPAFKGLDPSNRLALERGIMIHSSRWVDLNKWRKYIPVNEKNCQGCVTVSTRDMAYINRLMEKEDGNLLLWAYYDTAT